MESAGGELIQSHHPPAVLGRGSSSASGPSEDYHGTLICSNSVSTVQSSFHFPSSKNTRHPSSSSKDSSSSHDFFPGLSTSSSRDLPKLISKESFLHFSGVTSQPHSVIVENGLISPTTRLNSSRCPESGVLDTVSPGSSDSSSSLQPPPHSANGTPMCIKRGPGRPRKDGAPASKCSNSLNKFNKFCSSNYVSGNVRGVRGRKKTDGSSLGSFSSTVGSLVDLGVLEAGEMPMFTEDTMESDTSSVASSFDKLLDDFTFFPEQWPGKVCVFCNLGEKSMSGQGELLRLDLPPGFDLQALSKIILENREKEIGSEKSQKGPSPKRPKSVGKIKRLTSQGSLECLNEPMDEVVGYPDEADLSLVFDVVAGHFYVHSGCALWCGGFCGVDFTSFSTLEPHLLRALSQRCSHCGNFGAGVSCNVASCGNLHHLPCAATSGSFQEASSQTTICFSHLDHVLSLVGSSANCTVCDEQSNLASMIMCSTCGHHYHASCMALTSDSSIRAGWQCPACKMCQACRQPGEEGKLLACETCDKAYHIFCLRPALSSLPKHSWKCKMCRICSDCGARTPGSGPSSRWHGNFSVCDSCYQQRNKGLACPLCGKAYRHVAQKLMLQCHLCKKYVHNFCDPNADLSSYQLRKELYPDYEYICIPCKAAGGTGINPIACNSRALSTIKKSSGKELLSNSDSNSLLGSNFALSQDSLVFMEEDSLAGTESSIDLIWSDKARASLVLEEPSVPPVPPQQNLPLPKLSPPPPTPGPTLGLPQPKRRNGAGRPKTDKNTSSAGKKKGKGRLSDLARKRGPKPKMRGVFGAPGVGLQRPSSDAPKGEEEPGVENRLVLCSSKDEFVLQQDVCVMCGAFGNDLEGRLISCAQCGQCYHPFCVNVKVTKVVLQKGWRCLDCTVCEGCGQRHDEARLILCDDCDISFHIYCMNPPLDYVPQGNWKCKWCAICTLCGNNDPGPNSIWHKNYTLCGPCNSIQTCPVCSVDYSENELVIQCQNCDRWLHGSCDVILTEDEAEKCAEFGYKCVLCRPHEVPPPHRLPPPPPVLVKPAPKSPEVPRSRSSSHQTVDGVVLSTCGVQHIKGLSLDQPRKKRKKVPNIADMEQMEAGILAAIESVVSGSTNNSEGEESMKSEDKGEDSDKGKDGKKRRNLQKFGVGGFAVRLRGPRFKDEDLEIDSQNGADQPPLPPEKPKRKASRRKVKNKLTECFPAYLQEAFFGKSLMDGSQIKEEGIGASEEGNGDDGDLTSSFLPQESTIKLSPEVLKILESVNGKKELTTKVTTRKEGVGVKGEQKKLTKPSSHLKTKASDAMRELLPLSILENELVDTIMDEELTKVRDRIDDLGVRTGLVVDGELGMDTTTIDGTGHKDELTDFLSSIDTGLPSMDSKDVEDIFKGVLTDESHPPSSEPIFPLAHGLQSQPTSTTPTTPVSIPTGLLPQNVVGPTAVQGNPSLTRSTSLHSVPQGLASPLNFPPPSPYHSEYSNSPQFSPAFSEPPSPWPATVEGEVETPGNYSQRSILKWEVDEGLGPSATISAVLYANMNHPELKRDYQNWNERSKQIAKIWRSLPTDKRAPYLQKARENRAACRMQKAQQIPLENRATNLRSPPQPQAQGAEEPSKGGGEAPSTPSANPSPRTESPEGVLVKGSRGPATCPPVTAHSSTSGFVPLQAFLPTPSTPTASSSLTLSQPHRCFIVHINTSSPSIHTTAPSVVSSETKVTKVLTRTNTPPLPKENPPATNTTSNKTPEVKCPVADQQIRVLTPSEIMRTLPALSQETCGFPLLDQEKLMPPVKAVRGETQEERHWKQLQAYRQQQAQAQQLQLQEQRLQGEPKDNVLLSGKHAYASGIPMAQRQGSLELNQISPMGDHSRQPLQVTTSQHMSDGSGSALVSPHLQSPNTRQSFQVTGQGPPVRMRPPALEMPPPSPSPHYSTKPGLAQQHSPLISRSPMYSRIPYMHSPRPPLASPNDPYGNPSLAPQPDPYSHPPSTPRPDPDSCFSPSNPEGGYGGQKILSDGFMVQSNDLEGSGPLSSPRSGPQAQETRQHLRDLLQRQQIKKLEQDHSPSAGTCEMTSPSPNSQQRSIPPWPSSDDWQKVSMDGGNHSLASPKNSLGPTSPIGQLQGTQFRHPFLPQHGRMVSPNGSNQQMMTGRLPGPEFRTLGPHSPLQTAQQQVDPRFRVLLHQQQQLQQPLNAQQQQQRGMTPLAQHGPPRPLGFLQQQQQQQLIHTQQGVGQGPTQYQVRSTGVYESIQRFQLGGNETGSPGASSMLAQQLGRPLNAARPLHPHPNAGSSISQMQLLNQGNMVGRVGADVMSSDHQELPESVTAELEKLEEEQHRDGGVEADTVELADLGMDDDELLGMGADFNILEYADPELNTVVGGEKTNILDDNLDLEEEKEEEKELKRKEEEKHEKKEQRSGTGSGFSSLPPTPAPPSSETLGSFPPGQVPLVVPKSSDFPQTPPQPPPYPGPPPPYPGPGRPQSVGSIRNGGGLALPPVPPAMNMSMIFKNSVIGGPGNGRRAQTSPLAPIPPSHPSNLPANQRRTLLLQEQPLLLEDLLEQEKREQQRQGPMHLNTTAEEPLLSDFDFERLKADVLSSNNLPQSLSPPSLPGTGLLPPPTQQPMYSRHLNPAGMSSGPNHQSQLVHPTPQEWEKSGGGIHRTPDGHGHEGLIGLHPALSQVMPHSNSNGTPNNPMRLQMPLLPPPPLPSDYGNSEGDRQAQAQYEQWLYHQQQILTFQLKHFDGEVAKLRKTKKSLNSKQRQLRKNGSELNENDGMELERIVKELSGIQKQLEQARKQSRQHGTLIQEYNNKQQKRQQMLSMSQPMGGPGPGQLVRQNMGPTSSAHPNPSPVQATPLGNPNHSPHNSTPHSPLMSPSPSMSPLTQHSPMASPMAPSPGPGSNSMVQTSPRGSLPGIHHMDDRPFSPKNNDGVRPLQSPTNLGGMMGQQNRIQAGAQHSRMVNMGGVSPQMMQQNTPMHMLQNRMGMSMGGHPQQQQQRQMTFVLSTSGQQRMRGTVSSDQEALRMHGQPRYPRLPMAQLGDMLMRGQNYRQNFPPANPQQQQQSLGKPPGTPHYNSSQRVPFPVQSPTGVGMNMRSPSPLMQIGSPPGNQLMNQNRISPASSPMRRPSGSGSVGIGSPLPDRPKSVENPLTPRSGPHTPSTGGGMVNMGMEIPGTHSMDHSHFGKESPHHHQSYQLQQHPSQFGPHGDMGGGGGSSQMIPYPTFSWFDGPCRLGLKGGSPFSVVNGETHTATIHPEQTPSAEGSADLVSPTESSGLGPPSSNGDVAGLGSSSGSAGTLVGESQNALLKQLLQNTGCASTTNTSSPEPTRFSLSNCLSTRPVTSTVPAHTSQLSEAATRIPQPTSISRPGETSLQLSHTSPPQRTIKSEPMEVSEGTPFAIMRNVVKVEENQIKEESGGQGQPPPKEIQRKESFSSTLAETIDVVASDQTALDPSIYEARRAEDEARKAKRRQYTAKRRQSAGKEPQVPKKRARKGSKMEEDYELYLETMMSQLRQLQPIGIAEPELGRNYSICGVPGIGEMSKLHTRHYSRLTGDLVGEIGNSRLRGEADYYYTFPFGTEVAEHEKKPQSTSTQRGFYHQEFASPRMGSYCDRESSRSRSPSPGRDCDTPDTIVSSSSPEPTHYDQNNPFTSLTFIYGEEEDEKVRSSSPVYELLRPIPLRPVPQRFENNFNKANDTDKENKVTPCEIPFIKSRSSGPLRENGNVTVTLTLSSNAVDDVSGILRNLANILSISSPSGLQVTERGLSFTPPLNSGTKGGSYTYRSKDGKEAVDIQSILNGAAKFCRHCDVVVLSNIIRKKPCDLPGLVEKPMGKGENGDRIEDYYFCSSSCFMQFSMTHGIGVPPEDKAGLVVKHPSEAEQAEDRTSAKESKLSKESRLKKSTQEILDQGEGGRVKGEDGKQWKGIRYKYWTPTCLHPHNHQKYKKPTEKELTELLFRMGITVSPPKMPQDSRQCLFCHQYGDSMSDGPGRLLNLDVDKWVHLNCALWSEEVYETENGALVNAEIAVKQSLNLECLACGLKGATVKCFKVRCSSAYHLGCATKEGCVFYKNKTVYCSVHIPKGEKDNELTTLAVFRRVYIQRDENRQVAAVMHHADQHHLLRVGSLIFLSVGQLLPHQLPTFHTRNYIYPIGYKIVRFYWSMVRVNKRCEYICSIHEVEGKPEFRITVEEEGEERVIKSESAQGAWHQVLESILNLRTSADSIKVFPKFITGEDLFGLTEPAIVKVLESLPGVETLSDYHFKYGRNPLLELPLAINPTGCARSEPKLRTHFKRPHTQRTGSSVRSTYTALTPLSSSDAACPYSKQFVHSKSSQYRKMKQDWRNNVFLARSKIQGLGLYASRDIEKHTMVIEYIGEIIRSELAELREKRYEAQNRGIYMFRVDENRVIDATLCGGLARYINHSCNPNCVAEQVEVERDIRIIIFTNRRILRGEELSYDYKFEFEDDQHKLACLCGAPNCRQWMN